MDVFDTRKISARSTRVMGDFALAIPEDPREAPPDWIGYRASLARVSRRQDGGEECLQVCAGCGTELDAVEVVHSPRCRDMSRGERKPVDGWDRESSLAALHRWVEEHGGETPRADEWLRGSGSHPGYGRIVALFGSWRELILAAGLEPRKSGGRRPRTGKRSSPEQKAAAERAAAERRASYVEDGLVDPEELYG